MFPWTPRLAATISPRMLPFAITICGELEIACTVDGHTYAVSIMDPGLQARLPVGMAEANILRLNFHDLDGPLDPDHPARREWERRGYGIVLPGEEHIRAIIAFGDSLAPGTKVLVHCMAGISRSSAAAWILAANAAPGREAEMLRHIRLIRPQAIPNRLMIEIADGLLGAGGRMIRAQG